MLQRFHTLILIIIDVILINLSFLFSYLLRFDGKIPSNYLEPYKEIIAIVVVVKIIIFYFGGMYRSLWKYASLNEMFKIIIITAFGNMANIAIIYFVKDPFLTEYSLIVPRSIFVLSWVLDIVMIGGVRISYRFFNTLRVKDILKKVDKKRCLIVGAGSAGALVVKELRSHENLLRMPVAIIDDDTSKHGMMINEVPVVGDRLDIAATVIRKKIDEIIIAIPSVDNANRRELIEICNKTGVEVKILPGVFELIDGKVAVSQLRKVDITDLLGREPIKLDVEQIGKHLKDSVVMVTGGGGSIGSELCRQIAKYEPSQLIILDIYENTVYDIQNELKRKFPELSLKLVITSITDRESIFSIFEECKPNIIFHAAAHKHVPLMEDNPEEAVKNNVFGTLNVVQAADKFKVSRFVQISTDKAVNPTNVMGATKRLCEMIIQSYRNSENTKFVAVRFGNVLGSNGSVIPLFKKQISKGGPVTVTDPNIIRYFMTIPEAVQLVLQAGAMADGGEIFVLDMGEPVKIDKLARDLIELSGFKPDIDIEIKYTGLRPGEKLYEELLMAEEGLSDTKHEKIFVAKPMEIGIEELENRLGVLKASMDSTNKNIVRAIEEVVPTYKRDEIQHG